MAYIVFLLQVIHVSGQLVPFKKVDQNGERSYALVATGQPLPPPTICQLKLDTKCFVSRVGMDLRISFCEGKYVTSFFPF